LHSRFSADRRSTLELDAERQSMGRRERDVSLLVKGDALVRA
jgi:hypothetical protein